MTPTPVRTPRGPNHLARPNGRGYNTACGRTLTGGNLIVPPRWQWAHAWALEAACRQCSAIASRARTDRELARLAGW